MNKLSRLFISTFAALAAIPAWSADTLDADGYPLMYLRGADCGNWSPLDEYRFTRDGDKYSLSIPSLTGQFKISGDDWQYDYGGNPKGEAFLAVNSSMVVNATVGGGNFTTSGLSDVTISFTLRRDGDKAAPTEISFIAAAKPVEGLSGTLPVLYINVYTDENKTTLNDEIIDMNLDHKNYFEYADYWLDINGCQWLEDLGGTSVGSADERLPLQIKARGNWTRRGFSKKPFKLKLGAKQSLLGMSKSKHYAILAHADDNMGYMRNFVGFNLGKRIGLPWTPSQQPVEVVINGDYRGLYFLTESIRVEKDRVNITELDDNVSDPALVSGGYLVELDNYEEENQIRMEEKSCVPGQFLDVLRITFDTPEEYSDLQKRFISDQFTTMNDLIGGNSDDLWSYMDIDDAARYYIVEEIISNVESYHGSTYLYRDRGEGQKWHFTPLWDCGNAFNGSTSDFFYNCDPYGNTWIPSLRANSLFNDKVKATWLWFMSNAYDGIVDDIDTYANHIAEAAKADCARWKGQPVPEGGQWVVDNSDMTSRRNAVVNHLSNKTNWLKSQFGDYSGNTFDEPQRDLTPAAPLPDYAKSGVEDVTVDTTVDANPVYYNLQGIRIDNPAPGNIYIVRRGDSVEKHIYR